eukprot:GILK01002760.1.p1 GENE.GILK01002760.1~~GILK01002760.1.p1  ORF type:complete len:238 (+),score=27.44 GILK01002760.1:39-716(+)
MASDWPALESNPEVLTSFMHDLGLAKSWGFTDIFGLDEELLSMVPQPVLAVIFLFQDTTTHAESNTAPITEPSTGIFIQQTAELGNACGTIAVLHAILNNPSSISPDSILANFAGQLNLLTASQRAQALHANEAIKSKHSSYAQEGQTATVADNEVEYHFVCFTNLNGTLTEWDGLKRAPVSHGSTTPETLLVDTARIIKQEYLARNPDSVQFAMMALCALEQYY